MKGRFKILVGALILTVGTSLVAFAQTDPGDEYEEWQKAAREEQREYREYLKNPKRSNYLDWRSAQRDTWREHEEYKLALEISTQGYPTRRTVIVGENRPVERTVVVARTNGRYVNGTKVAYVNGNGKYVNGTKVAYVNGNGKRINGNGSAACGTGIAYRDRNVRATYISDNGYDEYEEWAAAEREVQREHQEFLGHPTDDNFAGWKEAQVDACREYAEYRAATSSVVYTTAPAYATEAVYTVPVVRATTVRRRAPVRRVRAKRVKRCVCR